jgi:subtilisin family serine protease
MKSILTAFICLTACFNSFALFVPGQISRVQAYLPDEIIAMPKNSRMDTLKYFSSLPLKLSKLVPVSYGKVLKLKVKDQTKLDSLIKKLRKSGKFKWVERNNIYRFAKNETLPYLPSDPHFIHQWGHENKGNNEPLPSGDTSIVAGNIKSQIQALKAWQVNKGSKNIVVAVIDTGINLNHPDLKSQLWVNKAELEGKEGEDDDNNGFIDDVYGYDFANEDGEPLDDQGHGSHCAGIIGAVHENNEGIAGVMANVSLMAVKFLDEGGTGDTLKAIKSIDYAVQMGAKIINASWGGGEQSEALRDAIARAAEKGVLFVAAAGNISMDIDKDPTFPASYDLENIISVAALNAQNGLAYFSNFGKQSVDITAPGHNILSTVLENKYEVYSGTSMATPYVAGAMGLLLSQEKNLSFAQIKERLYLTSDPVKYLKRKSVSGGRLNAHQLLTNFRPDRSEPDPKAWKTMELDEPFETEHPYKDNQKIQRTIRVPGAKYIRVVLSHFEFEPTFDYLRIFESEGGEEIERVLGEGKEHVSEYADGDEIHLRFESDFSDTRWGFFVEKVQYIKE